MRRPWRDLRGAGRMCISESIYKKSTTAKLGRFSINN